LRHARELAALTQAELADRAGIHRVSLANLERGAVGAQPKTVRALAQALGCSPADLMTDQSNGTKTETRGSGPTSRVE
jgi:transcriptional regulator with XRE-family HTH domain